MQLTNCNIIAQEVLINPQQLIAKFPLSPAARETVATGRETIKAILDRRDPRKILVIGPCSVHDPAAALDYARRLHDFAPEIADQFYVVMRVYFEKPRTTVGWKGLINDPDLNDTFDIAKGLHVARELLLQINEIGLPIATEALDPITPQYIGDLISWTAIGARTAESQTHREMSSGLSTPVGFKNGTDGSLEVAINAIESAARPHSFLGIDSNGTIAITRTRGNPYGHVVLRGGNNKPNYDSVNVALCEAVLAEKGLPANLIIDCSHANSGKDHKRQPLVFADIINQIKNGNRAIIGMMVESNLGAGAQKLTADLRALQYGVSITDACVDWPTTVNMLRAGADILRGQP